MPTMIHAGVYSAVRSYLQAIKIAGTDNANAAREQLGKMTTSDMFVQDGHIGTDGLMRHDMYLVEVKEPSKSKGDWDLMNVMATIPAKTAFVSPEKSGCTLVGKD